VILWLYMVSQEHVLEGLKSVSDTNACSTYGDFTIEKFNCLDNDPDDIGTLIDPKNIDRICQTLSKYVKENFPPKGPIMPPSRAKLN
jgi:hypothetical protein